MKTPSDATIARSFGQACQTGYPRQQAVAADQKQGRLTEALAPQRPRSSSPALLDYAFGLLLLVALTLLIFLAGARADSTLVVALYVLVCALILWGCRNESGRSNNAGAVLRSYQHYPCDKRHGERQSKSRSNSRRRSRRVRRAKQLSSAVSRGWPGSKMLPSEGRAKR